MCFRKKDLIPIVCGITALLAMLCYGYVLYTDYRMFQVDSFVFKGKKIYLIESPYNCGFRNHRMTERCLEVAIAKDWLSKNSENLVEIGAVTPYYFRNLTHDVCDPADKHTKVNLQTSMFNLDLQNKNVLSISTIEHIGTGEYGLSIDSKESAVLALKKILNESKKCLITFPIGANRDLEQYVFGTKFPETVTVSFFVRKADDNNFSETKDINLVKRTDYGPIGANAVVVMEKNIGTLKGE